MFSVQEQSENILKGVHKMMKYNAELRRTKKIPQLGWLLNNIAALLQIQTNVRSKVKFYSGAFSLHLMNATKESKRQPTIKPNSTLRYSDD